MIDYHDKKQRERDWYLKSSSHPNIVHSIIKSPIFYTKKRNDFNYIFPKIQVAKMVQQHLGVNKIEKLLIAPCGQGDDYKYLHQFAENIYGIDLSSIAIEKVPPEMITKEGDILESGYQSNMFDLVACPLFFHHMLKFGFDEFLNEFFRILKPGGGLVILEPSVYYPLNIITRPIKNIFNNPFNEVEDEAPIPPQKMTNALKRTFFINIESKPATFSHCSFYIPLAKIINKLTSPFLKYHVFSYISWMVIFWAEKPRIKKK